MAIDPPTQAATAVDISNVITIQRTISVTVPSMAHGILNVFVNVISVQGAGGDPTSVTADGNNMTRDATSGDTAPFSDTWRLYDPPSGTYDVVVNFSGNGTTTGALILNIAVSYSESDAALDLLDNDSSSANSDPTTVTVTTVIGALVIGGYASQDNNVAAGDNLSVLDDWDQGGNVAGTGYLIADGTSETVGWNRSATGQSTTFGFAVAVYYEADAGDPPTVAQDTADETVFNDETPTLAFTGTDPDGDDVRYNIQISDSSDFTSGVALQDKLETASGVVMHPNPDASATAWNGNIQIDDRPGQSFTANGGLIDSVEVFFGAHESTPAATSGSAYCRIYTHDGTFGTSSEPLNAALPADTPTPGWLAISDALPFAPGVSGKDWRTLDFSGANRVRLTAGEKYVLVIDWVPTDRTFENSIAIDADALTSGSAHNGNLYNDGAQPANNGAQPQYDLKFRVYEEGLLLDKVSGTDSGFSGSPDNSDPFASGQQVSFTVQAGDALDDGLYFWRVRGIDPSGSNTYGSWSATRSFDVEVTTGLVGRARGSSQGQGALAGLGALFGRVIGSAWTLTQINSPGALSGQAAGSTFSQGALTGSGALNAQARGSAYILADLLADLALNAQSYGTAQGQGALTGMGALSAQARGVAAAYGLAQGLVEGALSGLAWGSARALANLLGNLALNGQARGTGAALGGLSGLVSLNARAYGNGQAVGLPSAIGSLSSRAFGEAWVLGTLSGSLALNGQSRAVALAFGNLAGLGALSGQAFGEALAFGLVQGLALGSISGRAVGISLALAQASGLGSLQAQASGLSWAQASPQALGSLAGQARGYALALALAQGLTEGALSGLARSYALAYGGLLARLALNGQAAGSALALAAPSATGALMAQGRGLAHTQAPLYGLAVLQGQVWGTAWAYGAGEGIGSGALYGLTIGQALVVASILGRGQLDGVGFGVSLGRGRLVIVAEGTGDTRWKAMFKGMFRKMR